MKFRINTYAVLVWISMMLFFYMLYRAYLADIEYGFKIERFEK